MKSKIINQAAIEIVLIQEDAQLMADWLSTTGELLPEVFVRFARHLRTQLANIEDIPKSIHHIDVSANYVPRETSEQQKCASV